MMDDLGGGAPPMALDDDGFVGGDRRRGRE